MRNIPDETLTAYFRRSLFSIYNPGGYVVMVFSPPAIPSTARRDARGYEQFSLPCACKRFPAHNQPHSPEGNRQYRTGYPEKAKMEG